MPHFPRPLSRRLMAPLAFALAMAAGGARALDPALAIAQLHHDKWTSKDGMPGDVWEMAQDRDGWMWFATTSGLYRFDGVRFEHVRELGGTALLSNVLSTVRAFPDGSLWIGYRFSGLSVYRDGKLRHFGKADGYEGGNVYAVVRDDAGRTWSATNAGLFMHDGARWRRIGADWGLPGITGRITLDPYGRLWVTSNGELQHLDPGATRFLPSGIKGKDFTVIADHEGRLWAAYLDRVVRLPERWNGPGRPRTPGPTRFSYDAVFDRDGNLWFGGCKELCRIGPAELAGKGQLAPAREARDQVRAGWSGSVMSELEDREGNVWIATRGGVDRLRHDRLVSLGLPPGASYFTMALDSEGKLWVTGQVEKESVLWRHDGAAALPQPETRVSSLATGADGALLVAFEDHAERRYQDGRRVRIPFPDSVPRPASEGGARSMLEAGGALWATFAFDRTWRYADGRWRRGAELGLPDAPAVCIAEAGDGTLWFGYRDNEAVALRGGLARRYGVAEGLDIGVVGSLYDAGGVLVAGGDKGSAILAGGRFVRVAIADPQLLAGVSGIVRDEHGDLWFNGGKGLVRIRRAAWQAFLDAPRRPIADYELFEALDGYPGIARLRYGQSSLLLAPGGRLWVAGTDGVARIDPQHLLRNRVAPRVQVLALNAGARAWTADAKNAPLDLPPGTHDLQLTYTAPSFTMPERVRFRYRLEGVDAEWQEAGTRRTAYYNNLTPGSYRFRVTAANEDGVWNPDGASLSFTITPTFVQSGAFKLLCAVAVALGAWLLYRLRLRRATLQLRHLLQERANERERIARTLHDTLMQSVQALLMLFEHARDRLPPDSDSRPLLDRTLRQARSALSEGRDELSALRGAAAPSTDLVGALTPLGHILGEQFGVRFEVAVHGQRRPLCRDVALEACFIVREALQNAFRHAGAATVALDIDFGADAFVLRVRDDGRGMGDSAPMPGHWGLTGMRERAAGIGADLAFKPAPGGGTLVELTVPARQAYEPPPRRPWWRRGAGGLAARQP